MARIKVNALCNIVTEGESTAYRRPDGRVAPQITVPSRRLRLSVDEARALADALAHALLRVLAVGEEAEDLDDATENPTG